MDVRRFVVALIWVVAALGVVEPSAVGAPSVTTGAERTSSASRPSVALKPIDTVYATGAALSWDAYVDPSSSPDDDVVEYQVHRSTDQGFAPSAATLLAPLPAESSSFTDSTAEPTPPDSSDPLANAYHYMVVVKNRDGQLIPGPTEQVHVPKPGRVVKVLQADVADTTLSSAKPSTNLDKVDGEARMEAGNNSTTYGRERGVIKFPSLASAVPSTALVVDADLDLWSTATFGSGNSYAVHKLTRAFGETTATWNNASSGTAWTTPGGDYSSTPLSSLGGLTSNPDRRVWDATSAVSDWVKTPSNNHGLLLKLTNETTPAERSLLASSEATDAARRPQLVVTYLDKASELNYHAPTTPAVMDPGATYTVPITISNPSAIPWDPEDFLIDYRWEWPDGSDATTLVNRVQTPLPRRLAPGDAVTVQAQIKTPAASTTANRRTEYVLKWDVLNLTTGRGLSQVLGIPAARQKIEVEEPTSDQLGLERFYQYTGTSTGAGGAVLNNDYAGNAVWSYDAFSNPSRGVPTFVRTAYNSLDTSESVLGFGWSLQASSLMRLGTPLDFHPNPNPREVTLTDGDGTSHEWTLDDGSGQWISPKGVHLFLQRLVECRQHTEELRAWSMTRPDRTTFYFDCEGYLSSVVDNNGNTLTFTYSQRKSNNKPTKFLTKLTDATGRETLKIDYYAKGDNYSFYDSGTWTKKSGTNLTNPHIIDKVKQITDISGRKLTVVYSDKGLNAEMVDGAGDPQAKTFKFRYEMTQGNKNVKMIEATDPRGNTTKFDYFFPDEGDDPRFHWRLQTITDRLGRNTGFTYTDPDGPQGNAIVTDITDGEDHATEYALDGFGRPTQVRNAKNQTTKLAWDDDHNVVRLEEANTAITTWRFDPSTGYPLEVKDAEASKNGNAGTRLAYQTGLGGHTADLVSKTSPEGRTWAFTYTDEGDLASVTDPAGTATPAAGDFTTAYTYDEWGQPLSITDANGHTTTNSEFDANGYPQVITDALNNPMRFVYDQRGNVTKVTDASGSETTQTYDLFGRPLEKREPKDQEAGDFIVMPAPEYDVNDNITRSTAPNGAVTTASYDAADQLVATFAPRNQAGDPERKTSFTYDKVGNLLSETEPKGNLTAADGDFTTRYSYDEISQLTTITNARNERLSYAYDNVGNVVTLADPRKNATTDPTDFTERYTYDLAHRVIQTTDAAGKTLSTRVDRDGKVVATTDQLGNTTSITLDARGLPIEVSVPHKPGATRTTRFEYDPVGNRTKVVTPRGVATTDDPDDFTAVTVYDELNRVREQLTPFDRDDSRYNQPDRTIYEYDRVGRLTRMSAPPSSGESVRNDTTYTHFDNGWLQSTVDPWGVTTTYDYNALGQQTKNTLTPSGEAVDSPSNRTMTWEFFPDGSLKARSDGGVPAGRDIVLVDDSDFNNTQTTGSWQAASAGTGFHGFDYRSHAASSGSDSFDWTLNVPEAGSYDVYVKYPAVGGAATGAKFRIRHDGGATDKSIDQTKNAGTWVSLGRYSFAEGNAAKITLSANVGGVVVADAVKLVRDSSAATDTESKDFSYGYDPNGNLTSITDSSAGARIDSYRIAYTDLNQVSKVDELSGGAQKNSTSFTYNPNGAPETYAHERESASYEYDVRDLVSKVTNTPSGPGSTPKVTTFTYTDRAERLRQVKGNGNTVDYTYDLDGLLNTQVEKRSNGTLVSEHTLEYDLDGNRSSSIDRNMNADDHSAYLSTTATYAYDPRDRLASLTKTGHGADTETYVHDANNNVISQTVNGVTSTYNYDRNRLLTSVTNGVTSSYNYDPFGRLDTVTAAGEIIERKVYDGFDRVVEHRTRGDANARVVTRYAYDPLDRTSAKTTDVGTPQEKETAFNYLGLSEEVLDEEVAGRVTKSYQYSPWGERLSQVTHNDDGTTEDGHYGYNPHTDVEQVTDASGNTKATYGYTAYGSDDEDFFTGIDKPNAGDPTKEPYNVYRFNAKRWDQASGNYDMGFRDYDPGLNRFLTRDMYGGALDDLNLGLDPWSGSRYAFAGGNPINNIELDGHDDSTCHGGNMQSASCEDVRNAISGNQTSDCHGGNMQSASCESFRTGIAERLDVERRVRILGPHVIVSPSKESFEDAKRKALETMAPNERAQISDCDGTLKHEGFACDWTEQILSRQICQQNPDWCTNFSPTETIPVVVAAGVAGAGKSRPTHTLNVLIYDTEGNLVRQSGPYPSSPMTEEMKQMPGRRGELASHSEQRAYRDLRGSVRPGDRVYLFGERAACPTCRGVLNQWYREMGGQSRFIYIRPGLPPWEANGGRGYLRGDR